MFEVPGGLALNPAEARRTLPPPLHHPQSSPQEPQGRGSGGLSPCGRHRATRRGHPGLLDASLARDPMSGGLWETCWAQWKHPCPLRCHVTVTTTNLHSFVQQILAAYCMQRRLGTPQWTMQTQYLLSGLLGSRGTVSVEVTSESDQALKVLR